MIFILDAYNVIHKIKRLDNALDSSLRAGRGALIEFCRELLERRRDVSEIILVFDGRTEFHSLSETSPPGIKTIFSDTGEDADDRIISVLEDMENVPRKCVVSDDNSVRNTARAHKTKGISVAEFEEFCKARPTQKKPREENFLDPQDADEITREYKKKLGLS